MTFVVPKREDPKPATATIVRNGAIATIVAIIINVGIFLGSSTFTFPETAVSPLGTTVSTISVIALTLFGGIAAIVGYRFLLGRMDSDRAKRFTWILAVVVLLLFSPSPLALEEVPTSQLIIMEIMHVIAGVLPVYAITRA